MRRIKSYVYTAVIVPDNFFKALALVKDERGNTHGCLLGGLIGKIIILKDTSHIVIALL